MNWLPGAKVGDVFRWRRDGELCRIVEIRDNGVQINFVRLNGSWKGRWGYTTLPQDIELVDAVTLLGDLAR